MNPIPGPYAAAVIGATSGIGAALVRALAEDPAVSQVFAFARGAFETPYEKVVRGVVDITREDTIAEAAARIGDAPLRLVIVSTGFLHDDAHGPEKRIADLDGEKLARSFLLNSIGPALVAKHFAPLLARSGKAVFAALSARVGSIEDNRSGGWYGYRASKAALNQIVRTMAIEIGARRRETICVALHPGTVDTALSKPFQGGVKPESLFTPDYAAARLIDVIAALEPADTGRLIAWNGERIPF